MKSFRTIVLLIFSLKISACDLCGTFMGITPYDNKSQLTLLHRYRVFNGYRNYQQTSRFLIPGAYRMLHDPSIIIGDSATQTHSHSSKDYETYKIIELRGKYFLHPKFELNFIFPLQQIKTKYDTQKNTNTGISDPSLFSGYHLIRRLNGYTFRQNLIIGAGIKLPLGISDKQNSDKKRMSVLNQNGTGSFDHFYYVNYLMAKNWWGATTNCMVKVNGKNKYNERYATTYNQTLNVFVKLQVKDFKIFPAIFANYEHGKGLFINEILIPNTNVNVILLGPSIDINYKNLVLNASYQYNAYERVSSQNLSNAGRLVVGLTYNFNQTNYLIKNKLN